METVSDDDDDHPPTPPNNRLRRRTTMIHLNHSPYGDLKQSVALQRATITGDGADLSRFLMAGSRRSVLGGQDLIVNLKESEKAVEIVEAEEEVECGVVYTDGDGTAYYYEEVGEETVEEE